MQHEFDWNDLKFFLALHRHKRMTTAGHALGIDQTTVARRVKSLEKAIGAQLFTQKQGGYTATIAGERILPMALEVERNTTRARETVGGEAGRLSGVVRVGAPDGLAVHFVAPVLARFQEEHPDVTVELLVRSRTFRLSQQEAHLTFSLNLPTSGRLLARRMTEYHLALYASRGYLKAHGTPMQLSDLSAHKLVGYVDELLPTDALRYTDELGIRGGMDYGSNSILAQREAVREGAGIGVLPAYVIHDDPDFVPVLSTKHLLKRTLWILSHQSTEDLARVRLISEYIQHATRTARTRFLLS
ncbi:LysR family transcriptional regulator [Thioclava sp. SK-1]|uniref:LysR family transcriptional regulator n=1 Tax=Thioclava sp. SK-1 TaxID=1889770 RepID=UPI000825BB92|nr:LysR family transcriptional regulator [Thioclava sp. SK-1]OCX63179.1 LysR family transcriptional regulator [Thioclava sp. SK-1]